MNKVVGRPKVEIDLHGPGRLIAAMFSPREILAIDQVLAEARSVKVSSSQRLTLKEKGELSRIDRLTGAHHQAAMQQFMQTRKIPLGVSSRASYLRSLVLADLQRRALLPSIQGKSITHVIIDDLQEPPVPSGSESLTPKPKRFNRTVHASDNDAVTSTPTKKPKNKKKRA